MIAWVWIRQCSEVSFWTVIKINIVTYVLTLSFYSEELQGLPSPKHSCSCYESWQPSSMAETFRVLLISFYCLLLNMCELLLCYLLTLINFCDVPTYEPWYNLPYSFAGEAHRSSPGLNSGRQPLLLGRLQMDALFVGSNYLSWCACCLLLRVFGPGFPIYCARFAPFLRWNAFASEFFILEAAARSFYPGIMG